MNRMSDRAMCIAPRGLTNQQSICERINAEPQPPLAGSKLGIALSTLGKLPIHGLRHEPTETTNGWYIWCGNELSTDPEFFMPLHIEHMNEYLPVALEYLQLPPGYRFLIDKSNYEDIWFDEVLLHPR
jgi:hypothetical protein